MRALLKFILKVLAKATIKRYRPRVIAITGSVGKSASKEAIAAVLSTRFKVSKNSGNLNNEIGLPLAILNEPSSGYHSVWRWSMILLRSVLGLVWRPSYPAILVLEYGIDHPGDMDYLLTIAQPEIGVITAIAPTHLEFMGSIESVAKEKGKLVTKLPASAMAILNADDKRVADFKTQVRAHVLTYGFSEEAAVRAEGGTISVSEADGRVGVSFKLRYAGSTIPLFIPDVIGKPAVLAVLAAMATGISLGLPVLDIIAAIRTLQLPPGRMHVLTGIKHSTLIDDTYNSSPVAVFEALQALARFPVELAGKRWAVLGDMLELGRDSEQLHRECGAELMRQKIDYLVAIGERSRGFMHGAVEAGMNPDHMWHFAKSEEAGLFVQDRLNPGDVLLIKGSQGIRCERVTKELMAEPERAKELLVRQYKPWI